MENGLLKTTNKLHSLAARCFWNVLKLPLTAGNSKANIAVYLPESTYFSQTCYPYGITLGKASYLTDSKSSLSQGGRHTLEQR